MGRYFSVSLKFKEFRTALNIGSITYLLFAFILSNIGAYDSLTRLLFFFVILAVVLLKLISEFFKRNILLFSSDVGDIRLLNIAYNHFISIVLSGISYYTIHIMILF